jgi:alpha-tubulin suppressor-like RCC1 family protein
VEQVGVGEDFSCALRRGEVLCWGSDAHSRSGGPDDGTLVLAPRPVPQLTDAVWLGVGLTHGCAVTASGEVRCWGQNLERCLGFSTSYCCSADAGAVDTISGAVEVDGSYPHSCARLEDGAVWCWGLNSFGQLGQDVASESPPVRVLGIDDAVGIATGEYHNCAILASRDVVCWGTNASGALGGGTTAGQSTSPVVAIEGPER